MHTAGFMVSRMLGVAPTIADAIVEQLAKPRDKAVDAGGRQMNSQIIYILELFSYASDMAVHAGEGQQQGALIYVSHVTAAGMSVLNSHPGVALGRHCPCHINAAVVAAAYAHPSTRLTCLL
jgi:hypothetical protein